MFGRGNFMPYNMPYRGASFNMPFLSQTMNPSAFGSSTLARGLARGSGGLGSSLGRGGGLFSRMRNGINWSGLLNNTGRTLDVINRAIPIVKQAGPMFNNMKTMFRLASVFREESDGTKNSTLEASTNPSESSTKTEFKTKTETKETTNVTMPSSDSNTTIQKSSSSSPSFFI